MLRGRPECFPADVSAADSQQFVQCLEFHGISALLGYLAASAPVELPEPLMRSLAARRTAQVAQDLMEKARLDSLFSACAAENLDIIVLKGVALSGRIYPAAGLRAHGDVDILVRDEDWGRFHTLAGRLGWDCPADYDSLLILEVTYYFGAANSMAVQLDVHRAISNNQLISSRLPFELLYREACPLAGFGGKPYRLNDEYALFHACFHRAQSFPQCGDRLVWLYDINLLWRTMDAQSRVAFVDLALQMECAAICRDALGQCVEWFGLDVSQKVFDDLEQGARRGELSARLLQIDNASRKGSFLVDVRSQPGILAGFSFAWRTLFPGPSYMRHRYGSGSPLLTLYAKRLFDGARALLRK